MKKTFGFFSALLMIAALLVTLPMSAFAAGIDETQQWGDLAKNSGEIDGSSFLAGQTVISEADVKGIDFSSGFSVNVLGSKEYVLAAGYNVSVRGNCQRDAFAAGYNVDIQGEVMRDAYLAGNSVSVSGTIGRNLYVTGGSVTIIGDVAGDVYVEAENVSVGESASIGGTLHCSDQTNLSMADKDQIAEIDVYHLETAASESEESPNTGSVIWNKLCGYLGLVVVAFALLLLSPLWERVDMRYTGAPFGKYAAAFGIGFGVLAGVPVAAIVLMVTGFGLRLAFVLIGIFIAAILASPVFIGFFVGSLIWRKLFKKAACYWAELPIGLLIWWLASMIPVVSFIVKLVSVPLGLGIITLFLGKGKKNASPDQGEAQKAIPEKAQSDTM